MIICVKQILSTNVLFYMALKYFINVELQKHINDESLLYRKIDIS